MDRMSAADASFFYAETENTPMHVGSVAVFEGPAPAYGDLVRLLLGKLPVVPRYRQRGVEVPLHLGRPLWVDDEHFQILYHVRHTAVPGPGGDEQLRNLAGRVLGQRLDMTKPLWEMWLVEGLEDGRWALINKVHHCMIDGVAGADLMQVLFDLRPDTEAEEGTDWQPQRAPSTASVLAGAAQDTLAHPVRRLLSRPGVGGALATARKLASTAPSVGREIPAVVRSLRTPTARSLNGPIGPHRRWSWTETRLDDVKQASRALGGTVNDVVLTAITRGFRDLLEARGTLTDGLVVRTMVPVSLRRADEHGALNNQVSSVFVDLPVGEPDPVARLAAIRAQMDRNKSMMDAVDARSIMSMADYALPALMALGVKSAMRAGQSYAQACATNVPGPRVPLYVLGRRLLTSHPYVPVAAGTRISIGIFSYVDHMSFGVTADFDALPDIDVLTDGIRKGLAELNAHRPSGTSQRRTGT